jgi:hypothetical protein
MDKYLEEQCFKENPAVLDDDMPDFFENWILGLEAIELRKYIYAYDRQNNK